MKTIQEIMTDANRSFNENSYFVKSINKIIENGMKIYVTNDGRVNKRQKTSFIYNVVLSQYGISKYFRLNVNFTLNDLAISISDFVKSDRYKEAFKKNEDVSLLQVCPKCDGNCIITKYIRICSGICFECNGTGRKLTSINNLTIK